jgi:ligand-binding sensor domain-containing protein
MRVVAAALAFWLTASALYSNKADYKFRKIDITNGLSNNQVRTIFVDSKGYAWFGTVSGLNRFDGYGFKVFKTITGDASSIPFNVVSRIYEDYLGFIWVFNDNNLFSIYNPATETFSESHPVFDAEVPVPRTYISALLVDRDSCLWVGNNQHGLFRYCPRKKTVAKLLHVPGNTKTLQSDNITDVEQDRNGNIVTVNRFGLIETIDRKSMEVVSSVQLNVPRNEEVMQNYNIFIDSDGDFWVFVQNEANGLYFYSPQTGTQKWLNDKNSQMKLSNNIISGVQQDLQGMVWVAIDHGGINIIDKKKATVNVVEYQPGDANSLGQNSVTAITSDKNGIIWVGTFKSGVSFYHPGLFQFTHVRHNPFVSGSLPANDIDCFAEDAQGNLWLGTNGDGLLYYNRTTNTYKVYKHNPADPNSLSSDVVVSLCVDSRNRLWIGTFYGGLNMFDGRTFTRYVHDPKDPRTISDNRIWSILEDAQQRIWVATLGGGLDLYDGRDNRFTHYKSGDANSIHSDYVLSLAQDKNGNLWVGTSNGINVLDHRSGRMNHYGVATADAPGLSNGICMSVDTDSRGWTWVGTRNGLNVIDAQNNVLRAFTTKDGLADDNVVSVEVDDIGNVWMGTLNGICLLEVLDGQSLDNLKYRIRCFDTMDGVQGKEFNEHSAFKTRKGEILLGGANGYNIFLPNAIQSIAFNSQVHLTDLKLQNQTVTIGHDVGGRVILPLSIGAMDELVLKHNQNIFSLEFSALNFVNPEKLKYRYMLEGFNDTWIVTDANNRQATYTNLNPGTYVFRVMASDTEGKWTVPKRFCTSPWFLPFMHQHGPWCFMLPC